MNKLLYLAFFGAGVGIGILGTRAYFRTKTETAIRDALLQIDAAAHKAAEENKTEDNKPEYIKVDSPLMDKDKPDLMSYYKEKIGDEGYSDYSTKAPESNANIEKKFNEEPYVISPESMGEMDGYDSISLTLFADGVLTDDDFEPMEQDEIADCIGSDYQDHFGDYEDDAVHIRNDIHRTDYEILKDLRTYDEVARLKPKKARLNE